MLVGIIGPTCSGKSLIANYLVQKRQFKLLRVHSSSSSATPSDSITSCPFTVDDDPIGHSIFKSFSSFQDLIVYVLKHWNEDFVVCSIRNMCDYTILRKRPFFLAISVDSPLTVRFERHCKRANEQGKAILTLEQFMLLSDAELYYGYNPMEWVRQWVGNNASPEGLFQLKRYSNSLTKLMSHCDVHIYNGTESVSAMEAELERLDVTSQERLRPSWDTYFMTLSHLAAKRSNCMKRRVGCILVRHCRILSTGYNGTPKGTINCNEGGCGRCNDGESRGGFQLDACLCLHAEENALLEAGRERISQGDCVLYCNTCPCLGCAKKIVQCGVKEVVYDEPYGMQEMTTQLFKVCGINLRQFTPLKDCTWVELDSGTCVSELSSEE